MKRKPFYIQRQSEPGTVPGTIIQPKGAEKTVIDVIAYDAAEIFERKNISLGDIDNLKEGFNVIWIKVSGLDDINTITKLGNKFGLHHLALEDTVNVHQRPKEEKYDNHKFIVVRVPHLGTELNTNQISMFLGQNFILTFQEYSSECFDHVWNRIVSDKGGIRNSEAEFLCYALIDAAVDHYFPVLEKYGEILEELENDVVNQPESQQIRSIHNLKRDLLLLRRAVWPHREMINSLIREEHSLFSKGTALYLRDIYDHTVQLMDIIETYREIASDLVEIYMSSVSAKLNEIMKVLTIIATIFIPLSFVASLYGMNFDTNISPYNMPELGWKYGYPFAILVMIIAGGGLFGYFWKNNWISRE